MSGEHRAFAVVRYDGALVLWTVRDKPESAASAYDMILGQGAYRDGAKRGVLLVRSVAITVGDPPPVAIRAV